MDIDVVIFTPLAPVWHIQGPTLHLYVALNMRTISLCEQGLPICEISGLPPRTHTGTPRMRTGIGLRHVSDLSSSHALKQKFV
jgi:hypothetical protein